MVTSFPKLAGFFLKFLSNFLFKYNEVVIATVLFHSHVFNEFVSSFLGTISVVGVSLDVSWPYQPA